MTENQLGLVRFQEAFEIIWNLESNCLAIKIELPVPSTEGGGGLTSARALGP